MFYHTLFLLFLSCSPICPCLRVPAVVVCPRVLSLSPQKTSTLVVLSRVRHFTFHSTVPICSFNAQAISVFPFLSVCLSAGHLYLNDSRWRQSEINSRTMSESNVCLSTFHHMDNSANFDTVSMESSDSLETSISACSPDNISR